MIDLLALQIPFLGLLLWLARKRRDLDSLLWLPAALAALFHALAVLIFFSAPVPDFTFTQRESASFSAGVRGEGKVLRVDGREPASLGRLAALFLHGGVRRVETSRGDFSLPESAFARWPWEAFDGGQLEEASGGLVMLDRQPVVLSGGGDAIMLQISTSQAAGGLRIERAAGVKVSTVREALAALEPMPDGGVTALRVMRPSPDANVSTVIFSPGMMPAANAGEKESTRDKLLRVLGFTGVFVQMSVADAAYVTGFPEEVNGAVVTGARGLFAEIRRGRTTNDGATSRFRSGGSFRWGPKEPGHIWVRPRVALLPWIGSNALDSWVGGVLFSPVRQLVGLSSLPLLSKYWAFVPHQLYSLDDSVFRVPGFVWFRLSSIFVSVFLALLTWKFLRPRLARWGRPPNWLRGMVLFGLVLLLQFGDVLKVLYLS